MRWRRRERQDGRRGKRDGRQRIPTYTGVIKLVEAGLPVLTVYHEHLLNTGRFEMNEAFRAFVDSLHPHRKHLIPLNNGLAADLRQVAQCREELLHATAELSEDELRPRNPREASLVASGALLDRRRSMRRQRIEAARLRLTSARNAAQVRRQAILDVHALIAEDFAVAQAQGWRHHDRCLLRIGRYWEGLVQTHPEGPSLVSILPKPVLDKPDWLTALRWQDTVSAALVLSAAEDADTATGAVTGADADTNTDTGTDANTDTDTDTDPDTTWPTPDGTAPEWLRQEF